MLSKRDPGKFNRFEQNSTKTLLLCGFVLLLMLLLGLNYCLQGLFGFGRQVIYDNNPHYGYRPQPYQTFNGFYGKKIKINNLGLRCNEDWDATRENKILFLGDSVTYGGAYITNDELFSTRAVATLPLKSGNGGVNAWGVENIHGLLVKQQFLPAGIYVTTLIEDDFYRGVTRIQGLPFWNRKPGPAIVDALTYLCYLQNNRRYSQWQNEQDANVKKAVVENAVIKLKEMDSFLKAHNLKHFIFISPTRDQVFAKADKDLLVAGLLEKHGVHTVYIRDRLLLSSKHAPNDLFRDSAHLARGGHELWSQVINAELKLRLKAKNTVPEQTRPQGNNQTVLQSS